MVDIIKILAYSWKLYFYFIKGYNSQKLFRFTTWTQTVISCEGPWVTNLVDQVDRIGPNSLLASIWSLLSEQTLVRK